MNKQHLLKPFVSGDWAGVGNSALVSALVASAHAMITMQVWPSGTAQRSLSSF